VKNKCDILDDFFSKLIDSKVNYIILRKSDLVYDVTIKNDIDLIVKETDLDKINSIAVMMGFKVKKDSPIFNIYLYGARPHVHVIDELNDIHIDIVVRWQHKSLNSDRCGSRVITKWIPVHEKLQIKLWENTQKCKVSDWCVTPSNENQLMHIMAHVLLDKKDVPVYYKDKIKDLLNDINEREVLEGVELIFYKFSSAYLSLCKAGNFEFVHQEYLRFGDY